MNFSILSENNKMIIVNMKWNQHAYMLNHACSCKVYIGMDLGLKKRKLFGLDRK